MKNKFLLIMTILFTFIWMGVIFSFSNASSDVSNNGSKTIIRYIVKKIYKEKSDSDIEKIVVKINKPFRKFAHASVYLVLANFVNSVLCVFIKNKLKLCNMICLIVCFLYACTDEWHQTFISHRTGQISDVFIDTFGALIGCVIFDFIYKKVKSKDIPKNNI